MTNLVGNAVKFTSAGHVLIEVDYEWQDKEQARMKLTVRDTGIGIPREKLIQLFQKFSQADASTTRKYGGTGLGLAISKQLIELMGGSIEVTSEPGCGSSFCIRLPLPFDGQPYIAAAPVEDLKGLRVLIVDDNEVNRRVVHEQISSLGMRNGSYASAQDALEAIRRARQSGDPYQIVIADYNMPGIDGATMAAEIKSDPEIKNTVVVMLTSVGHWRELRRLEGVSIEGFLLKPVRQSQLTTTLLTAWSKSRGAAVPPATAVSPSRSLPATGTHNGRFANVSARVLVAEDNIVNQKVISRMLEKLGVHCDVAGNGREAIQMLGLLPYDLVFMDCQMPEMNGYEAAAEIRRQEGGDRRVAIIAMTAEVIGDGRQRCLDAGMDDFVPKPVRVESLVSALKRWTPARQPQRA
jgi:CheY-like chemotaxis protein